ncbi:MAG: hypothetical protein IJ867_00265, partial [Clostridia bacterium]|nr:hypothetical protein [Clostridia bacterium]
MQDKKLHKLGKTDLLTIIYEQQKEIESLKGSVKELENQLADRTIKMKEAGSIADASLKLNKIFEAAQEAADQYLNSIKAVNSLDSKGYAESVTKDEIQKDTYVEEVNVETIVEENNLEETKSDVEEEENSPNMYLIPLNRDLTIVKPKLLERMKIFFVNVMKLVLIFFHTLRRTTKTVLKTIFLKTIFVLKQLGKGIVKLLKWLKNVIVKLFKFLKSKICLKQMVLGIGKGIKKVFLKILAFFKLIKTKLSGLFQKKKETKK